MIKKKTSFPKKIAFLLFALLSLSVLNAQITPQIFTINNTSSVSIEKLSSDASGNLLFSGLFDGSLELDGVHFQSQGETDIYIGKQKGEELLWVQSFGSIEKDEILALASDKQDNIYIAGSYFETIIIGTTILTPATGVRGHFIAKLSPLGAVIWAIDVNSSGEQVITDLVVNDAFQVYVCGYFGGTFLTDQMEMVATAETDLMVLQFSENGVLQQAYQAGITGKIRGQAISVSPSNDQINISGIYKGVIDFDGEVIQTNTNDFDIFVLQLNENFNVQWAKKAGGVYEENNAQILTDEADNIYVIGDFQGVIRLGEIFEITTNGVQDNNLYILKYNKDGTPLFARSLGGTNFDFVTDAVWASSGQIAVCGSYQTEIKMDNFSLTSQGQISTYTVGISSEDGAVEWLDGLTGEDLVLGNSAANINGQIIVGGSFNNSIIYQSEVLENNGSFDGFLHYSDPILTPTTAILKEEKILIYPNPSSDFIYIHTNQSNYQMDLYSISGQLMGSYTNPVSINLRSIQNGIYILHIRNNKGQNEKRKIIVQKE